MRSNHPVLPKSGSYIPEYSQTPILEGIAKYAANMAPEVYQWGMTQFNKNQGNIDRMMQDAMSYASRRSGSRRRWGMAQAGVMQGAEQGRQNAQRDLEGFGIDPSSGRYAALDSANRMMAGAMAAGAGNQQRMATEAAGGAMKNQAMSASLQNTSRSATARLMLRTSCSAPACSCSTRRWGHGRSAGRNRPARHRRLARRCRPVPGVDWHEHSPMVLLGRPARVRRRILTTRGLSGPTSFGAGKVAQGGHVPDEDQSNRRRCDRRCSG